MLYSAGVLNTTAGSVTMHVSDAGINFIASVAVMEDITIEPYAECVLPGEFGDSSFQLGQQVVVEPLPNSAIAGTLAIAHVLAKASPQALPDWYRTSALYP